MKVILTEKQFREYLNYQINEAFVESGRNPKISDGNPYIGAARDKLLKQLYGLYSRDAEYRDTASKMGFLDGSKVKQRDADRDRFERNFTTDLRDEIIWGAKILRQYTEPKGNVHFDKLEQDYPNDIKKLLGIKEFLDMKGLSKLYFPGAITSQENAKAGYFGFDKDGNITDDTFTLDGWIGQPSSYNKKSGADEYYNSETGKFEKEKLTPTETLKKMRESFLNRYMTNVYGMGIDIPKETFVLGNHKLSDTTLIVNFTSAMRCPAWNECLLKEVCYARDSEKGSHANQRDANTKKNLMWEAGHRDPEILKQIFVLLRLFVIDYGKAIKEVNSLGKKYTVDELSQYHLSDLDEAVREILGRYKRVTDIRLNENGDFIGQWLLDAIDSEAGDFLTIGVNTSAYTCRNIGMDYSKVQNLIINCSNKAIKGESIQRYFLAVDDTMYRAFDETYGGPNNSLVYDADGKIAVNPQPLYKNGVPTGDYYYKCPCGRIKGEQDKVDCYRCRLCYTKNDNIDATYYVLVNCHGANSNSYSGRKSDFGFSKNYFANLERIEQEQQMEPAKPIKKVAENIIKENIGNSYKEALKQIAYNCVSSIKNHLSALATGENNE